MAIELGVGYLSVIPETSQIAPLVRQALGDTERDARGVGGRAGSGFAAGLIKTAGKAVGGAALLGIGAVAGTALTKGFTRAVQLQEAEAKLSGLGNSAKAVSRIMDDALKAVSGTAFGLGEAATVAASAVAAGIKPGKELQRNLTLVGDAATIAGVGMGEMGAIFNKVAASNKLQLDVINQLHDAGVPALQLVAQEMGVTAEEASKMASAGKVDFETFQRAMEAGLGGAAQKSGETFKGSLANMGAALGRLGVGFANPLVTGAPALFTAITGAIDSLGGVVAPAAEAFGAVLTPAIERAADAIGRAAPTIEGIRDQLGSLDLTGVSGPIAELAPAVWQVVSAFSPLGLLFKVLAPVLPQIAGALGEVAASLAGGFVDAAPALATVAEALARMAVGAVELVAPILANENVVKGLVAALLIWKTAQLGINGAMAIGTAATGAWAAVTRIANAVTSVGVTSRLRMVAAWVAETAVMTVYRGVLVATTAAQRIAAAGSLVATNLRAAAAWTAGTAAMIANRAATVAITIAQKAARGAMLVAAAAQWALNAAWTANPIGLVIAAIAALVAGLVWFFTKTELGRKIWDAAWTGIKKATSAVVDWFTQKAIPWMRKAWDGLVLGAKIAGKIIAKTWSDIKAATAKPINFVIETVYNKGIAGTWNKVADAVGLDLKLPTLSPVKFATGGVLPGYTPGRDVHDFYSPTGGRLSLSGGEAIMRPEFTRAVGGPAGVAALNARARKGQAFKDGGVFGFAGDAVDWIKDKANIVGKVLGNPVGALKDAISGPMQRLLGGIGGGSVGKIVAQLPTKVVGSLINKAKELIGGMSGLSGGGKPAGPALGWQNMWNVVRSAFPGASLNSSFRPGAITAVGTPSYHGQGRAIDVTPDMAIFNWIAKHFPNSRELIYSPANGRQIWNGRNYQFGEPTRGDHWDHVHWAMRNGGVLPKLYDQGGWLEDGGLGLNRTGKPEAVLTPAESKALKAGVLAATATADARRYAATGRKAEVTESRRRVVVQIGAREFEGYMRDLAEDVVEADRDFADTHRRMN